MITRAGCGGLAVGGSNAEDISGCRRSTRGNVWLSLGHEPHFTRHELALQNPARAIRFVSRPAVPQVSVEDQRGTGFGDDQRLVGMVALRLLHRLWQRL